jgi:hypothetical protein
MRIAFAAICERASFDPQSNTFTVLSACDVLSSIFGGPNLPLKFAFVFTLVPEGEQDAGEQVVRAELREVGHERVLAEDHSKAVRFAWHRIGPHSHANFYFTFDIPHLPGIGDYELVVRVQDRVCGKVSLYVRLALGVVRFSATAVFQRDPRQDEGDSPVGGVHFHFFSNDTLLWNRGATVRGVAVEDADSWKTAEVTLPEELKRYAARDEVRHFFGRLYQALLRKHTRSAGSEGGATAGSSSEEDVAAATVLEIVDEQSIGSTLPELPSSMRDELLPVRRELTHARAHLEAMITARDFEDFEREWKAFLDALERAWNKAEQVVGATGSSKAQPWIGRVKGQRKSDPLLAYLHHARNAEGHTIEAVLEHEPAKVGVSIGFPGGGYFERLELKPGLRGGTVLEQSGGTTRAFLSQYPAKYMLRVAVDRNTSYDPPTEHLSKQIPDATPIEVARLGLKFYVDLLAGANAEMAKWHSQ